MNVISLSKLMLCHESMTQRKLQKLCYYAYVWYLVKYSRKITEVQFAAWTHGPVSLDLYHEYSKYGWDKVPQYYGFLDINIDLIPFCDEIYDIYGKYSEEELEELSKKEAPWNIVRDGLKPYDSSNRILSDYDIFTYYSECDCLSDIRDQILFCKKLPVN